MGVSAVGAGGLSMRKIHTGLAALLALGSAAFYLYGPAVTPALHGAAARECNELVGGDYRSYSLRWVVGSRPHWVCGNRFRPAQQPVDLGWWVTPF